MMFLLTTLLLIVAQAFAASGGHGGGHGEIPKETAYQALNLTIFIGLLVYFTRAKIRALFLQRYENFTRLARETEQTRKNLEFKIADIIRRTEVLEQTSQKSLQDAQRDAEKMLTTRLADAKESATRIENEVSSQINDDQKKIIEKLRNEALEMSVAAAEQELQSVSTADKDRITKQFNQRVEGATI